MPRRRQRQEAQPKQNQQPAEVDPDDVPFIAPAARAAEPASRTVPGFVRALAKLLAALSNVDDPDSIDTEALARSPDLACTAPLLFLESRRQVDVPHISAAEITAALRAAQAHQHVPNFNVPRQFHAYLRDARLMPARSEPFFPGLVRTDFQYYAFVKQQSAEEAWAWEDVEYVTYKPANTTRSQGQRARFAAANSKPAVDNDDEDHTDNAAGDAKNRNQQHLLVCVYRTRPDVPREYRLTAVPWCHTRQRAFAPCIYEDAATQCNETDFDEPLCDEEFVRDTRTREWLSQVASPPL